MYPTRPLPQYRLIRIMIGTLRPVCFPVRPTILCDTASFPWILCAFQLILNNFISCHHYQLTAIGYSQKLKAEPTLPKVSMSRSRHCCSRPPCPAITSLTLVDCVLVYQLPLGFVAAPPPAWRHRRIQLRCRHCGCITSMYEIFTKDRRCARCCPWSATNNVAFGFPRYGLMSGQFVCTYGRYHGGCFPLTGLTLEHSNEVIY